MWLAKPPAALVSVHCSDTLSLCKVLDSPESVGHCEGSRGQGRSTAGKRLAQAHSDILWERETHDRPQNAK